MYVKTPSGTKKHAATVFTPGSGRISVRNFQSLAGSHTRNCLSDKKGLLHPETSDVRAELVAGIGRNKGSARKVLVQS